MSSKIKILYATIPSDDYWVAEIYHENNQWAEISQKQDGLHITIFSVPSKLSWTCKLEEFKAALVEVEKKFSAI